MMMAIMERTAEIGTCMALGRTRGNILRNFICEGLAIGAIGGVAGVFIGWLLAELISWVGIPMPPPPGMSRGYTGAILFTWSIAIQALLVALGTTLIASAYPAWRASKVEIVDALRHSR
jgi:putative ABC transport system permease protein